MVGVGGAERSASTGKPPPWADPVRLPALPLGDRRLNEGQIGGLLLSLHGPPPGPPPLVGLVKKHFEPAALEAFAWRLFEQWLAEGGPAEERWAMQAVGLLGGDAERPQAGVAPPRLAGGEPSSAPSGGWSACAPSAATPP